MADFPTALSNVTDNVDDVLAKHLNNVEATIGITGSAVTTSHDYKIAARKVYHGVESVGTLDFVDADHIFSVSALTYWYKGTKYTTANPITCDIDDTDFRDNSANTLTTNKLYYFYCKDATGKIWWSDTVWSFTDNVFIATVYWNGSVGAVQKETHSYDRDIQWHLWAHDTIGTRYESGFTLTAPTAATDNALQIETGVIHDEDIDVTTGQMTSMRGWRKTGASTYTFDDYAFPYLGGDGDPKWVDVDNSYTLTSVNDAKYVCYWVYASLDIDKPCYVFPTTANDPYDTVAQARAEAVPSLLSMGLNAEMKLIYRFIYKGDGQFQEYTDYRTSSPVPGGGASTVAAGAVSFLPSGNISSTSVQTAIEELDSEKVILNGALGTPTSGTVTNLTGTASININGTVGATTPTTGVFTTATTNTGLVPDANDGAYLGQAGTAFSDLFLASGGVINWDSGDVTLTHSANTLTLDGGFLFINGGGTGTFNINAITLYEADTLGAYASLDLRRSLNNTVGTITQTTDNSYHGVLRFQGVNSSSAFGYGSRIISMQDGAAGATYVPSELLFQVSTDSALTTRLNIKNTGAICPGANDGGQLGSTALQWGDLFLAEGGVINWDNGDATITQTGNAVDLAGADFHTTTILTDHIGEHTGSHKVVFDNVLTATSAELTTPVITTSISGTAIATGAEVTTGTDDTQIVTPKALGDAGVNTRLKSKVYLIGNRDMSRASEDVAYTSIGFTPTALIAFSVVRGTWDVSFGFAASDKAAYDFIAMAAGGYADAGFLINLHTTLNTNYVRANVKSYDSDGFTLSWTKTGSPTGNSDTCIICLR